MTDKFPPVVYILLEQRFDPETNNLLSYTPVPAWGYYLSKSEALEEARIRTPKAPIYEERREWTILPIFSQAQVEAEEVEWKAWSQTLEEEAER